MSSQVPRLSKSRLLSAQQCLKMLHYESHHPELAVVSRKTQAAFRTGGAIGEIAKAIYGCGESVEIAYRPDTDLMVDETMNLLGSGARLPIFEATFRHEGVLVRVDVLLPDGDGWRAVEIKASTRQKPEHVTDCAIQWWVLHGAGFPLTAISLGHVNNQFVYSGDGHYAGLIREVDLTGEVRPMSGAIENLVAVARTAAAGPMPNIPVGKYCHKPYDCAFLAQCWPQEEEFPVSGIGGSKARHAEWVRRGIRDLREIPGEEISAEKQRRIHRVTVAGNPELVPGAAETLGALEYPRFYLDFETVGPAVPIWVGTRPYQPLPVQFSVHIDEGEGRGELESMRHEEFLDLSGEPPMRALALRLIDVLGSSGTVLMYTDYELRMIKTLIELFPDLASPLQAIVERLFDLAEVVEDHYYHPKMLGSWSIKAVAPAMIPGMEYAALEGINEGTAASEGYLEAIKPGTTPERKAELESQLLRYCRFDTEAMVGIVQFLAATVD